MQKYIEDLEVFDLNGNFLGIQNRDEFYREIKEEYEASGKITRQVKTIRIIVMNSSGRIYIQKRSREKGENAGLYDKTVGGHVTAGYSWDMTVVQECNQELGFPIVVLPDDQFDKARSVTDLEIMGIAKMIDNVNSYISLRKTKKGDFKQPFISRFYFGYYDGAIRFKDGESTGIEVFSLDELKKIMTEEPEKFTSDLRDIIKNYSQYLEPIVK